MQALFNILGRPSGRSFLDLFAGTGRVGEEALARGFSPVTFVELSGRSANAISLRMAGRGPEIIRMDVRRVLATLVSRSSRFDVIFADPPYSNGWVQRITSFSARLSAIMSSGGIFVLEHTRRELPDLSLWGGWEASSKTYGDTMLSFFQNIAREGESV